MIISLIAALTTNHVIGIKNGMPWFFPIDMKWFQYHTLHKPIIMGRKTFDSIGKKPLKHRLNIILSRFLLQSSNNICIVNSIEQALSIVKNSYEVMVIGGGEIYKVFFPQSKRLYLTYIHTDFHIYGDTWFPSYDIYEWKVLFSKFYNINRENCYYNLSFNILERL